MKYIVFGSWFRMAAIAALSWSSLGVGPVLAQTKVPIANLVVNVTQVPLWVAQSEGLFAKRGIDVQFRRDIASRGIGDQVPFGVFGAPALIERAAEGRDLKILATLGSARATSRLMVSRDIKSANSLKGKRFGVITVGTGYWIDSIQVLERLGIDAKREGISFIEHANVAKLVQSLEEGQIDALIIDPGQATQLEAKGFTMLFDMYAANLLGIQTVLLVTGSYAREHPAVVENVVAGLIEGIAYCLTPGNEEVVKKSLAANMKLTSPVALETAYRDFLDRALRKPYASMDALRNMQRVMGLHEPAVLSLKLEELVDDRSLRALDDSGRLDRIYRDYKLQ
jgi:ABC-type nitrate/sulfonate/bicarbonate transport system substrate-binding protein